MYLQMLPTASAAPRANCMRATKATRPQRKSSRSMLARCLALGLAAVWPAAAAAGEICPQSGDADAICLSFCSGECDFNSANDTGTAQQISLYRVTPRNVTDIANKNTGDPPGDIGFYLSRMQLVQQCARDPNSRGCFLAGDNVFAEFTVEVDGRFGPYQMCNPVMFPDAGGATDTRDFECSADCLTPPDCSPHHHNGSGWHGGISCFCDRANKTVGRESRSGHGYHPGGVPLPPQCGYSWETVSDRCVKGEVLKELRSSEGAPAVQELLCEFCQNDPACVAWTQLDATTGHAYSNKTAFQNLTKTPACLSATKSSHHYHSGGLNWYGVVGTLGGHWYSTPTQGECKDGAALGTNGCTWRLVAAKKYVNESCVNANVDRVIEQHNSKCFAACPDHGKDTTSDCYLQCYYNALVGDDANALEPLASSELEGAWLGSFASSDPAIGGCPSVKTTPPAEAAATRH